MKSKKGVSLTIETLVIIILAVIVLITVLIIFSSGMRMAIGAVLEKIKDALGLWQTSGVKA